MVVASSPHTPHCAVEANSNNNLHSCFAGSSNSFNVLLFDHHHNRCHSHSAKISASLQLCEERAEEVGVAVEMEAVQGGYCGSYIAVTCGQYKLSIRDSDGQHLPQSPLTIQCSPNNTVEVRCH